MPRFSLVIVLLISLVACTLSTEPPAGPTPQPTVAGTPLPQSEFPTPTPLPGVQPGPNNPGGLPTRTPIGFNVPATPMSVGPAVPTSPTGEYGQITAPANGASVPVGTLQVSGVVGGLPRDEFTLQLLNAESQVLNSQLISLRNPNQAQEVPWSAAMTTGSYTGPAEVRVIATDAAGNAVLLARTDINLVAGGPGAAPAPVQGSATVPTGSISSPVENATVSGTIQVSGTAGGIPENQFVLALVAPDGTVLNSQIVTLTNSDYTVVVPWAAALGSAGFNGPAEIRAFTFSSSGGSPVTFATVRIFVQ